MKKTFKDIEGNPREEELKEHDISKYDYLIHITLKNRRKSIEEKGLLRHQETHKSIIPHGILFLSYPMDNTTGDCFRWSDEHYSMIALDAKKLREDGFVFYDDPFGQQDANSKRNHICCDADIPAKYIKKIFEF